MEKEFESKKEERKEIEKEIQKPVEPREFSRERGESKTRIPWREFKESVGKLPNLIYQKTVFSIGGLWQSMKIVFGSVSQKMAVGTSSFNRSLNDIVKRTKNDFISFAWDLGVLKKEIKMAIFKRSSPMQISNVKVSPLSPTSMEITWETSHKATSKVNYGLTRVYNREKQDSKKVKKHSVILDNLNSDTLYHYEVISQNGTYAYDADRIFYTPREE